MGKFVIIRESSGGFQFYLKAANGETLLSSDIYLTKTSCENGIFSVKNNLRDASKLVRRVMEDGKAYFNIKAINERIIGTSQIYENQLLMLAGLEAFKFYAPSAIIEDQSI